MRGKLLQYLWSPEVHRATVAHYQYEWFPFTKHFTGNIDVPHRYRFRFFAQSSLLYASSLYQHHNYSHNHNQGKGFFHNTATVKFLFS